MRGRSKAGSGKSRRGKPAAPKRLGGTKPARPQSSSAANQESEIARLSHDLNDALERETAASEILNIISSAQAASVTLGTIGFEGRFDYAAIGTVSNIASRLCDEAKPGQILINSRVLTKVENAVTVEPTGAFALKGIRRPMAAYNVLAPSISKPN
jgi:class 3 adenylate cyclase